MRPWLMFHFPKSKIRLSAGTQSGRSDCVCLRHGGLFKILHPTAWFPTRGARDQPSLRRRDRRGGQTGGAGVREVNLLGQNVNAYRGMMHDGGVADLALLIRYVAAIDGIDRIGLPPHPVEFSDSLIDVYADVPGWSAICICRCRAARTVSGIDETRHSAFEYKSKIRRAAPASS